MRFFIDSNALDRLTDPKLEIRQRALSEISSIIINNILFEVRNPLADNEQCVVNLDQLTRQLIRWFQFKPITNENEVFDLLIRIFSRKDFLNYITQSISIHRLQKEVTKIAGYLIPSETHQQLQKIESLLADFENDLLVDIGNIQNETLLQVDNFGQLFADSFTEQMNNLQISPTSSSNSLFDDDDDVTCRDCWIQLKDGNLDVFNDLEYRLQKYGNKEQFEDAINFTLATINDFPPEFYLQPPNVLKILIDLLPKAPHKCAIEIIEIIHLTINGLKERDLEARKNNLNFIPVKKHMNSIIRMLTSFFKRFHDKFKAENFHREQAVLNSINLVLFDIAEFMKETQNVCDIYINELMNMIAKVARDFRNAYEVGKVAVFRLYYTLKIYLINAFVSVIDVDNIMNYCENNLWEYECDLALLDWPLKAHTEIVSLIKRNRREIIADDSDMKFLVSDIKKIWAPVTNLFRNWKIMTDEEIITTGLKCIDSIRIVKSEQLVEVLFNSIINCSSKFNVNKHLKEAAEEIFLRLLCIDMLEIQLKIYTLARNNVQKKLSDDQEEKLKNTDLCNVIGIPISTEIITEILCFGYSHNNEEIHEHSKMILFALLRAKIVFPNHWLQLLEFMKPVLPLTPGLFKSDHKLGFFSFDIFHEHSGFDDHELNRAFTRFLFCKHPKARQMAKIKLLENLNVSEYTNDFIEIIPNDFCLLPDEKITPIEMMDRNVGYDTDVYQKIKDILETCVRDDVKIIKTLLLQLNALMNSLEFCKKSHDENLWIHFILTLDMGFPNNFDIRRLVISILRKWAIAVSSFRIYLANEPTVLKFLINTLIYCQDDFAIKKLASTLLFLLSFSDFAVTTDTSISLPSYINSFECPFKYDDHWIVSPFNKISQFELLYEGVRDKNDHADVQETTMRYLRFTFAAAWFKNDYHYVLIHHIDNEKYYADNQSAMKIPNELVLSESDNKLTKDTVISRFMKDICQQLDNSTTVGDFNQTIQTILCTLMLPNPAKFQLAENLEKKLKRFAYYAEVHRNENQKSMLLKCLIVYENIVPWLSDKKIAEIISQKTFTNVFNKEIGYDEVVYIQILKFINTIVKMCEKRRELSEIIIKEYNTIHKSHFSSNLIEKLVEHFTDVILNDKSWNEVKKIPSTSIILTTMNNVLRRMPILLDEPYINSIFQKLTKAVKIFFRSRRVKSNSLNSHLINQLFAIVETITSLKYSFKLKDDDYNTIIMCMNESERTNRAILWTIIANLTSEKDTFNEFCRGYKNFYNLTLNDFILQSIGKFDASGSYDLLYLHEQKALALVIGNFIEHSTEELNRELYISSNSNQATLAKTFLYQKWVCIEALRLIIKKMIQNNTEEVAKIVRRKKVIERLLENDIESVDALIACHEYENLKEHVNNIVVNMKDVVLVNLISSITHSTTSEDPKEIIKFKRLNQSALNLILILLKSSYGLEKLMKALRYSTVSEKFILVIYDGLKTSNSYSEINYHLLFLNSMLTKFNEAKSIELSIFGGIEFRLSHQEYFAKIIRDVQGEKHQKLYTIYEKNIRQAYYPVDLMLLQAINIFNYCDTANIPIDHKYSMKISAFGFIRNLLAKSERARNFASEINLMSEILARTKLFVSKIDGNPRTEMSKKSGIIKSTQIFKNFCIFLKAITEWSLSIENNEDELKDLFDAFIKVHDWISADTILSNCFINFIRLLTTGNQKILKECIMQEVNEISLIKMLLKKGQAISAKPPHTESSLSLLRNGMDVIERCCNIIDVRLMLKNTKAFQTLEVLHPQLVANKKSTWNDVIAVWLKLFEAVSRYDDSECSAAQIALLCRLFRIGNAQIKSRSLKIIRNFSMKSSIGYVVLISDDFIQTVDSVMSNTENYEKIIILQTLLSIVRKSEQSRSKLKNSSLNRKMKDHISRIEELVMSSESNEVCQMFELSSMLKNILYT